MGCTCSAPVGPEDLNLKGDSHNRSVAATRHQTPNTSNVETTGLNHFPSTSLKLKHKEGSKTPRSRVYYVGTNDNAKANTDPSDPLPIPNRHSHESNQIPASAPDSNSNLAPLEQSTQRDRGASPMEELKLPAVVGEADLLASSPSLDEELADDGHDDDNDGEGDQADPISQSHSPSHSAAGSPSASPATTPRAALAPRPSPRATNRAITNEDVDASMGPLHLAANVASGGSTMYFMPTCSSANEDDQNHDNEAEVKDTEPIMPSQSRGNSRGGSRNQATTGSPSMARLESLSRTSTTSGSATTRDKSKRQSVRLSSSSTRRKLDAETIQQISQQFSHLSSRSASMSMGRPRLEPLPARRMPNLPPPPSRLSISFNAAPLHSGLNLNANSNFGVRSASDAAVSVSSSSSSVSASALLASTSASSSLSNSAHVEDVDGLLVPRRSMFPPSFSPTAHITTTNNNTDNDTTTTATTTRRKRNNRLTLPPLSRRNDKYLPEEDDIAAEVERVLKSLRNEEE